MIVPGVLEARRGWRGTATQAVCPKSDQKNQEVQWSHPLPDTHGTTEVFLPVQDDIIDSKGKRCSFLLFLPSSVRDAEPSRLLSGIPDLEQDSDCLFCSSPLCEDLLEGLPWWLLGSVNTRAPFIM